MIIGFLKSKTFRTTMIVIFLILLMIIPATFLGMYISGWLAFLWIIISIIFIVGFAKWVLDEDAKAAEAEGYRR